MTRQLSLFFFLSALILPFLNFARFSPLQDWWTNGGVVALLAMGIMCALLTHRRWQSQTQYAPWFLPGFLSWWLLLWLGAIWRYQYHQAGMLPFDLFGILVVALGAVVFASNEASLGRQQLVTWLAVTMVITSVLQGLIGMAQLAGWARLANGWLVYNAENTVMGNIGQRNQFAHVLAWGMIALAYLWARRWLKLLPALVLGSFFALLMAWSQGRLPIAYAIAMFILGIVWKRRLPQSATGLALCVAALAILFAQALGPELAQWLFGVNGSSGLDRLGDAGFGARRRIEWLKSWEIVKAYPWLGTGFGGYAYQSVWLEAFGGLGYLPESSLFTHSHNIFTQLASETGVPATLLAIVVIATSLLPYLQRHHATDENAFLLTIAAVILIHSMFEYPLWYLPFTFVFMLVLALSPRVGVVMALRSSLVKLGGWIFSFAIITYIVNGVFVFPLLVTTPGAVSDVVKSQKQIEQLLKLSTNPFWRFESGLMLSNFLVPSSQQLGVKLQHYEELVSYRPYPMLLCKLSMLQQWSGQYRKAGDSVRMLIAAFPDDIARCTVVVANAKDASLQPLLQTLVEATMTRQKKGELAVVLQFTKGVQIRPPELPYYAD